MTRKKISGQNVADAQQDSSQPQQDGSQPPVSSKLPAPPNAASMRAFIAADQERRAQEAWARMQRILEENRCQLAASPRFVSDGVGGWRTVCDVHIQAQE